MIETDLNKVIMESYFMDIGEVRNGRYRLKDSHQFKEISKYVNDRLDIEDNLGIDLVTLVNIYDYQKIYVKFFDEIQEYTSFKVDLRKRKIWYCKQSGGKFAGSQDLSNFNKSWFLNKPSKID